MHYDSQRGFPILVKLIDAQQSLSLQVHPGDEAARRLEGRCEGKNEMWYVISAQPGAKLVMGFELPFTKVEIRDCIHSNTMMEVVRQIPVQAGDCFPIPAGMLHAIGKGVLIAEIQQSSNITPTGCTTLTVVTRMESPGSLDKALEVLDSSLKAVNVGRDSIMLRTDTLNAH
jgi:mannose-6-phosphate isomerase class I